jgi:hypothetical protein
MKNSRTVKCFKTTGYGSHGPDYRLIIESEISENFKFSVKADDLQNQISFFTHIEAGWKCFDGMTKRELLDYYNEMLREEELEFSELSDNALKHCSDFDAFCDDVITFEALKLVEDGKPILLAQMGREITIKKH